MYVKTSNVIEAIEERLKTRESKLTELNLLKGKVADLSEKVTSKTTEALARGWTLGEVAYERYRNDSMTITVTPALNKDAHIILELLRQRHEVECELRNLEWQERRNSLGSREEAELKGFLIRAKDQEAERPGKSINAPQSVIQWLDASILNKD
jgi:hypothetical protein